MALLDVQGLTVAYGGSVAVADLTFSVEPGQLVGLIGPNGAGKTTTVDAITGFVPCTGAVRFADTPIEWEGWGGHRGMPPARRARLGLARTWQGADLFVDLPVLDNLRVAGRHEPVDGLFGILRDLGIEELAAAEVGTLSHGQRKLVGVARALAARPRLICMDEPAAGLDTKESEFLGARIRAIADAGTAVLLIDHDMGLVLGICDQVCVLDFGRLIASGTPQEIRRNPAVIEAYLGRRHANDVATEAPEPQVAT